MATMDLVTPPLPLHLGALHPVEQALVYLLAFGPFVVLALVVVARRRQDRREEPREDRPSDRAEGGYDGDAAQRDR
jgi:hypothetical protein